MFTPHSEFSTISSDAQNALSESLSRTNYGNNEVVYLQDDEANYLYFVASGYVRLSYLMEDGSAILYAILPPGESFGELGIFDGGLQCDMAMGVGPTVVARIPAQRFDALRARHPDINDALARSVARRYRSYIELTRIMSLKTLPARVAQALLRLVDMLKTCTRYDDRDLPCLGPMVTQADLGLMARGARGNVNRALKDWERAGWIAIRDRSIIVIDRDALAGLALEDDF
jgi:CRP/FNR family cyclic AMP-dependent transcriptional regulator